MTIFYKEYEPSALMKPFIDCFWTCHTDGEREQLSDNVRCFPSGMLEWIIHVKGPASNGCYKGKWEPYPRSMFCGITDHAVTWNMYGDSELLGIRLTPEGMMQLFQTSVSFIFNYYTDAEKFLGNDRTEVIEKIITAADIKERMFLVESFIHSQLKHDAVQRNYFAEAMKLLRDEEVIEIADVSKQVFVGERQLQRAFKSHLGISPKNYHRLMRLKKAHLNGLINAGSFTTMAYQLGYADAAHFSRDFKTYFGEAPASYFAQAQYRLVN